MTVSSVGPVGFQPYVAPQISASGATTGTTAAGSGFGDMVVDGLNRLESVQDKSDKLAVQAATGDLTNIHDYTVAATEAAVTTQLTVAVRNRALESFNEIMRMPIG
jgi:flagellar hook-basal body complex protein FliE